MAVCLPDTSCLIHLERIDRLDLLRALYDEIRIPPAVRDAYGGVPKGVDVVPVSNSALTHRLRHAVDAGEAEVIALGTETDDPHVVLDDRLARREAADRGLTRIGTVGLLLRAKRNRHISAVRPLLDALRGRGRWMPNTLAYHALWQAGERPSER